MKKGFEPVVHAEKAVGGRHQMLATAWPKYAMPARACNLGSDNGLRQSAGHANFDCLRRLVCVFDASINQYFPDECETSSVF